MRILSKRCVEPKVVAKDETDDAIAYPILRLSAGAPISGIPFLNQVLLEEEVVPIGQDGAH